MRKSRLTLSRKKALMGMLFVLPWFLGFAFLFTVPLLQSLQYSFSNLKMGETGLSMNPVGWANYIEVFTVHPTFNRVLYESVINMVINVPLIIFFSLFIATILNQKFRGRSIARAIFFLPVIISTGLISSLDWADFMGQAAQGSSIADSASGTLTALKNFELERILFQMGVPSGLIHYLSDAVNRIYQIISASGVQIIIFLAGLQSISPSLYEASRIEGATAYDNFWKITFPQMTPLILTNTIYSIIDSFLNSPMSGLLNTTSFRLYNFGLSAGMSWVYFLTILVLLGLFTLIISKRVFYYDS